MMKCELVMKIVFYSKRSFKTNEFWHLKLKARGENEGM